MDVPNVFGPGITVELEGIRVNGKPVRILLRCVEIDPPRIFAPGVSGKGARSAVVVYPPVVGSVVDIRSRPRTELQPADVLGPHVTGQIRVIDRHPAMGRSKIFPSRILRQCVFIYTVNVPFG
ncbi:MAG: hypothetical protein JRJ40_09805 [Deltaproteobacteria bacterium]|nr:hypothetical protein [Deltaproteobacteria bacterium]